MNLASDILEYVVQPGENNNYRIPDIMGIGAIDAGAVASGVFAKVPSATESIYVPWAGTTLFSLLGVDNYYEDWLLTEQRVTGQTIDGNDDITPGLVFKGNEGTYDLITTLAATERAFETPGLDIAAWVENIKNVWNLPDHIQFNLELETNVFFDAYYGLSSLGKYGEFNPGSDMPFNFVQLSIPFMADAYYAGSLGGDEITDLKDYDVIHSGLGNDTIQGSLNYLFDEVLINGGAGRDLLDLSQTTRDLKIQSYTFGAKGYVLEITESFFTSCQRVCL